MYNEIKWNITNTIRNVTNAVHCTLVYCNEKILIKRFTKIIHMHSFAFLSSILFQYLAADHRSYLNIYICMFTHLQNTKFYSYKIETFVRFRLFIKIPGARCIKFSHYKCDCEGFARDRCRKPDEIASVAESNSHRNRISRTWGAWIYKFVRRQRAWKGCTHGLCIYAFTRCVHFNRIRQYAHSLSGIEQG